MQYQKVFGTVLLGKGGPGLGELTAYQTGSYSGEPWPFRELLINKFSCIVWHDYGAIELDGASPSCPVMGSNSAWLRSSIPEALAPPSVGIAP